MTATNTARPTRLADVVPHTYDQAAEMVGDAPFKVYTPHLALIREAKGDDWSTNPTYALRMRGTNLVTFYADGMIVLRAPSWRTSTVRVYFNAVLHGSGYSVREYEGDWVVISCDHTDPKLPNGMARFHDRFAIYPTAAAAE